ncbi:MAG: LysR family transcriptional regulator [Zoogloeaceae bacterium]|jgi:DNA-binding transcriptional LysR family regulator|nr:LysR family transcriptional regulator [Zoogloeaceae bacterium]
MFEPEVLRAFIAVVENGSFTRASERLHLTQSAISQQIRRLEASVGRPLFKRTTRRVEVNADGEIMLFHARRILDCMNFAQQQLTSPSVRPCTLRLGVTEDMATMWLHSLLSEFAFTWPMVHLDLSVGITKELRARLDQGEIDLVMGKRGVGEDRGEAIGTDRLVWIGSPKILHLAEKHGIPLAVFPSACIYRACIINALQDSRWQWRVACTSPSLAGIRAAVAAETCLTALPGIFAGKFSLPILEDVGLPRLPDIEFALFAPDGDRSPAEQELKRLIRLDMKRHLRHRQNAQTTCGRREIAEQAGFPY